MNAFTELQLFVSEHRDEYSQLISNNFMEIQNGVLHIQRWEMSTESNAYCKYVMKFQRRLFSVECNSHFALLINMIKIPLIFKTYKNK